MRHRNYVLVANDKSPSDALGKLGHELDKLIDPLEREDCSITLYLGGGKLEIETSKFSRAIKCADIVLIGMSSRPELSEYEILAADMADRAGVDFGFYSDTFYAYRREWFSKHRHNCSHLFITSAGEMADAQDFFPAAKVSVVGNPSWEDLINPNLSDDAIRQAIGGREAILVPGNKTHHTNVDLVRTVLTSIPLHKKMDGIRIVFAPHPGELKQDPDAMAKYREEIGEGLSEDDRRLLTFLPKGLHSRDVLRVAWATVSACSPTTDLQAVFLRVPAFNYLGHLDTQARLMKEFGSGVPELCSLGVVEKTTTPFALQEVLNHDETLEELKAKQLSQFPEAPTPGKAVGLMVTALSL